MHGRIAQAEFGDGAKLYQITRIRRAAGGREFGREAGDFGDGIGNQAAERTGRGEEGFAVDTRGDGRARAFGGGDGGDAVDQRLTVLEVVEADAEPGGCLGGDDIGGGIGDVDGGDLDVRRLEPVGAVVEVDRFDGRKDADQCGNRVIGEMGVGNVTLRARNLDPDVDRTAPPDLDRVAQPDSGGGFADEAQVGDEVARTHPVDQRDGAIGGGAFFVAGDDESHPAIVMAMPSRRRDEGGN